MIWNLKTEFLLQEMYIENNSKPTTLLKCTKDYDSLIANPIPQTK